MSMSIAIAAYELVMIGDRCAIGAYWHLFSLYWDA